MTTSRAGDNTTAEFQGQSAKEEDRKPFHQLYNPQFKPTQSTRETVPMEYIRGK